MKTTKLQFAARSFVLCAGMFALAGCQLLEPPATPTKDTQTSYITVEFPRFVSGVYVKELANKYVQVDCQFSSIMAGTLPGGFSPDRFISFMAGDSNTDSVSPETLTVIVPKDLADIVFTLKHTDKIRVRGRAVQLTTRTIGGSVYGSLALQATFIEKIK